NGLRGARGGAARGLARARLDIPRPLPAALDGLAYVPPAAATLNGLYHRLGFAELLVSDGDGAPIRTEVCDTAAAVAAALARLGGGPIALHALLEDPAPVRETLAGGGVAAGKRRGVLRGCRGPPAG